MSYNVKSNGTLSDFATLNSAAMSRSDFFKAASNNRKQFAASGVVTYSNYSSNNLGKDFWTRNLSVDDSGNVKWPGTNVIGLGHVHASTGSNFNSINKGGVPTYNVDGNVIQLTNTLWDDNVNYKVGNIIHLPKLQTTFKTLTSRVAPAEGLVQNETFILDNLDEELYPYDMSVDGNVDKFYIEPGATCVFDSDKSAYKIETVDNTITHATYFLLSHDNTVLSEVIAGCEYKIVIDIELPDSLNSASLRDPRSDMNWEIGNGINEVTYIPTESKGYLYVSIGQLNIPYWVKSISIKQVKPELVSTYMDIEPNADLQTLHLAGGIANVTSNLCYVEAWYEDVTEKDFVFPYGNVQFSKYEYSDNIYKNKFGTPRFDGWELYCTQIPSTNIFSDDYFTSENYTIIYKPKGYKWSILTLQEKMAFISNPDNNMFIDGDKIVQFRFRITVAPVSGKPIFSCKPSSYYENLMFESDRGLRVTAQASRLLPLFKNNYGADGNYEHYFKNSHVKDSNYVSFMRDRVDEGIYCNGIYRQIHGGVESDMPYMNAVYALPLCRIERYNTGAFHPIYNPLGTAIFYEASVSKKWFEVSDGYVTSVKDCFDTDKIAVINVNDVTDNASYTSWLNGDVNNDTYKPSFYAKSKLSGRDDNAFSDIIMHEQLEDLRIEAVKKSPREILDGELKNNALNRVYNKQIESNTPKATPVAGTYSGDENGRLYLNISKAGYSYKFGTPNGELTVDTYHKQVYDTGRYNEKYVMVEVVNPGRFNVIKPGDMFLLKTHVELGNSNTNPFVTLADLPNWADINYSGSRGTAGASFKTYSDLNNGYMGGQHSFGQHIEYEILGDIRNLGNRVSLEIKDTTDVVNIAEYEYILCTDATDNNGTAGHVYLNKLGALTNVKAHDSSVGTANANDGHIDFSVTDVWKDLGSDLTALKLPDELSTMGGIFSFNTISNTGHNNNLIQNRDLNGSYRLDLNKMPTINARYPRLELVLLYNVKTKEVKEMPMVVSYDNLARNGDTVGYYYDASYNNAFIFNPKGDTTFLDNEEEYVVIAGYKRFNQLFTVKLNNSNNDLAVANKIVSFIDYAKGLYNAHFVYSILDKKTTGSTTYEGGILSGAVSYNDYLDNNFHPLTNVVPLPDINFNHYLPINRLSGAGKMLFSLYRNIMNGKAMLTVLFNEVKYYEPTPGSNKWYMHDDGHMTMINNSGIITNKNGEVIVSGIYELELPYVIDQSYQQNY